MNGGSPVKTALAPTRLLVIVNVFIAVAEEPLIEMPRAQLLIALLSISRLFIVVPEVFTAASAAGATVAPAAPPPPYIPIEF